MSTRKMKVINDTKEKTLGWKVEFASSFWMRLKGLMGRKEMKIGSGLILSPCNSIHTFFMSFPLDVIFLDKNRTVICIKEHIPPFRIILPVPKAHEVLELPQGTIKLTNTEPDDKLVFKQIEP